VFPAFLRSAEYTLPVQATRLGVVIALTQTAVYGAVAIFVATATNSRNSDGRNNEELLS